MILTWAEIILMALKVLNWIMDTVGREKLIQQGRDEEIARQAAALLSKTEYARGIRDKLASMDEKSIDDVLDRIESSQLRPKDS